uniref:Uncharacterized protein n=1 Tax=Pygocentrus nattereri TaxID=42514 RepID=A0AAR2IQD5_PYGNA
MRLPCLSDNTVRVSARWPTGDLSRVSARWPTGDLSRVSARWPTGDLSRVSARWPTGDLSRVSARWPTGDLSRVHPASRRMTAVIGSRTPHVPEGEAAQKMCACAAIVKNTLSLLINSLHANICDSRWLITCCI